MTNQEAKKFLLEYCRTKMCRAQVVLDYNDIHASESEVAKWKACVDLLNNTKTKEPLYGADDELPETD